MQQYIFRAFVMAEYILHTQEESWTTWPWRWSHCDPWNIKNYSYDTVPSLRKLESSTVPLWERKISL